MMKFPWKSVENHVLDSINDYRLILIVQNQISNKIGFNRSIKAYNCVRMFGEE